jgi:hypothetical protein
MSGQLKGTSTGGGGKNSPKGRPQTGQQPNPKRPQLEGEEDHERTVEDSGGEGEESRREPLHEITLELLQEQFDRQLDRTQTNFMNKLEKQSMALNTVTMEKVQLWQNLL